VCSDAVVRWFFGQLYVVGRFGCDNITIYDPATFGVVRQFSVGNGSNPNDIYAVSPTKAYVTRYDSADLWIVNPSTGAFVGAISLAAFADADNLPEMNRLTYHAGRLFVSVQRLDRDNFFSPTDHSLVVVIDTQTDQVVDCNAGLPGVQGIVLPATNPTTEFATTPEGDFLLGCTGFYGTLDGGVARIDPRTLTSEGLEATESNLGGDVNDVAVSPGASGVVRAFCVISDASFNTSVVTYLRATGGSVQTVHPAVGFSLADIEVDDREELYVCDRTFSAPGVRVFDGTTLVQLTTVPLATGLPPQDICFDAAEPVGVADRAPVPDAAALAFAGVAPNPSAGTVPVAMRLRVAGAGTVRVTIADVAGRAIRTLERAATGPGDVVIVWDGADRSGRPAPPGVYLARASQEGRPGRASARLVRMVGGRL
jgi:hypothetical protein